jgi:hypothetical protein
MKKTLFAAEKHDCGCSSTASGRLYRRLLCFEIVTSQNSAFLSALTIHSQYVRNGDVIDKQLHDHIACTHRVPGSSRQP